MSKQEIFDALKNKNLFVNKEVELKPGNLLYFVLWFSDKPVMYSFTSYYKGMDFSGYDEKTIKEYDLDLYGMKRIIVLKQFMLQIVITLKIQMFISSVDTHLAKIRNLMIILNSRI